jgi:hypothetical protein
MRKLIILFAFIMTIIYSVKLIIRLKRVFEKETTTSQEAAR